MKYTVTGNYMVATAESKADNEKIVSMMTPESTITHRKHKKHAFSKTCAVCGRVCKGLRGLGVHSAYHKREMLPPVVRNTTPGSYSVPVKTLA